MFPKSWVKISLNILKYPKMEINVEKRDYRRILLTLSSYFVHFRSKMSWIFLIKKKTKFGRKKSWNGPEISDKLWSKYVPKFLQILVKFQSKTNGAFLEVLVDIWGMNPRFSIYFGESWNTVCYTFVKFQKLSGARCENF